MAYLPIEDHGVIGDLHSVALVGTDGTIDFWCFPHFDSPAVFCSLLDDKKGGSFQICPTTPATHKQLYLFDTNILLTRFLSEQGVGEVVDLMPVRDHATHQFEHRIVRLIEVVRGTMTFKVRCRPSFDWARASHETTLAPGGAVFASDKLSLALETAAPLRMDDDGSVVCEFTLHEGEFMTFQIAKHHGGPLTPRPPAAVQELIKDTSHYWRRWLASGHYSGRWREMVNRSALALKLLTFQPTGAIVASPTTSLPELVGGARNWDYRYTWIRDASFTLYGLLRVGFTEEAHHFMRWLSARLLSVGEDGRLGIMYSIEGKANLHEVTLDHLDGYMGSKPVRIGNGAAEQLQLDIYGELMDAAYLYNKYGSPIGYDLWLQLTNVVNWVCDHWMLPDDGIWEVRGGQRHFVYSKVMCWVALDRAIRLADKRSFPAPRARWLQVRDEIYEEIMSRGWNPRVQAFTQSYDSDELDASNLIMPLVFFQSPNDPRMQATIDATMRGLVSDSLVHRYKADVNLDGLEGGEGTFSICTFWLVEALTRAGRVDEARAIFEKMLTYANHLGLYSEEIGLKGEALGNFPQAFTHLALISAAWNLTEALDKRRRPYR